MLINLIRHTTPDIEAGICYGHTDLDLAHTFEQEKDLVLSKIENHYDIVYTSPLQRCTKLAQYIKGGEPVSDARLMEYNFGDWELMPWEQFKSGDAKEWMNNFVDQPSPNGDSIISMQKRVDSFWQELLQQQFDRVAVVTHSGVQRLIHAKILETPLRHLFRLQLEFGAVLEINAQRQTELMTIKHL